jgi:uncharacterized ParB-like nuclease family protein
MTEKTGVVPPQEVVGGKKTASPIYSCFDDCSPRQARDKHRENSKKAVASQYNAAIKTGGNWW